jgi:hypothetical protein
VAATTPAGAGYQVTVQQVRLAREQARPAQAGEGKGGSNPYYAAGVRQELAKRMDLGASVAATASAAQLGDFFQYVIEKPVSLPRQKSALLAIVGKDVEGTGASIYNERAQAKFPLLGLKLKNTSGLHLLRGPITLFEGGTYARITSWTCSRARSACSPTRWSSAPRSSPRPRQTAAG